MDNIKRNVIIIKMHVNKNFFVHNGKKNKKVIVKKEIVGKKFGEFVITKKNGKKLLG